MRSRLATALGVSLACVVTGEGQPALVGQSVAVAPRVTVSGTVVDESGRPVSGGRLLLLKSIDPLSFDERPNVRGMGDCGVDGTFAFRAISTGRLYLVTVGDAPFGQDIREVDVVEPSHVVAVTLPKGYEVKGSLEGHDRFTELRFVVDGRIWLATGVRFAHSPFYELYGIPPGRRRIAVVGQGLESVSKEIFVSGDTTGVDFVLAAPR